MKGYLPEYGIFWRESFSRPFTIRISYIPVPIAPSHTYMPISSVLSQMCHIYVSYLVPNASYPASKLQCRKSRIYKKLTYISAQNSNAHSIQKTPPTPQSSLHKHAPPRYSRPKCSTNRLTLIRRHRQLKQLMRRLHHLPLNTRLKHQILFRKG